MNSLVNIKITATTAKNGVKYQELLLEKKKHKIDEHFSETLNVSITEGLKNNGTMRAVIIIEPVGRYSWLTTKQTASLTRYAPEMSLAINLMGSQDEKNGDENKRSDVLETVKSWLQEPALFQENVQSFSMDFISRLSSGLLQLKNGVLNIPSDFVSWLFSAKINTVKDEPKNKTVKIVSHFRHELSISLLAEDFPFGPENIPPVMGKLFELKNQQYLPLWVADNLSIRSKKLLPISGEIGSKVPITLNYNPVSIGKFCMIMTMEESVTSMKSMGFNDNDLDDVKSLFTDTNFFLLVLTVFVSVFHLLFDFLAFKNDISFWRNKQDMVGLSMTAVIWRFVSTFIIMLYLFDESTSKLVLYPMLVSTVIEFWKLTKAFKVRIVWPSQSEKRIWCPRIILGNEKSSERATNEFDNKALHYLTFLMVPLVTIGAIYSLVYVPHKSVYSWIIQSLVNGVYAFGFLFMLPQLFVNYKLKSVAHLPWKAFMYKAFNTFIDDVFAFIITMPTAHRLACFRDDIIFVIYLYQRYLYPVDKTRTNEFGQSFDQVGNEEDKVNKNKEDSTEKNNGYFRQTKSGKTNNQKTKTQ